jgi:glycosyltransferase involved in cell wall biosynthesis
MNVGIYNRWLMTLGGGERHSLAVAEYLSRSHSVTVISHVPVPRDVAARRLNLDLSRVKFITIPDRPALAIALLTADYDLFLNASHMDFFPCHAAHSSLLIYFPVPPGEERAMRWRSRLVYALKRWLMVPAFVDGVLDIDPADGAHRRRANSLLRVELPPCRQTYQLDFDLAAEHASVRQMTISLDGRVVERIDFPADRRIVRCRVTVPGTRRDKYHEMSLESQGGERATDSDSFKIGLAHFRIDHPRYHAYQFVFERYLRGWGLRMHRIPARSTSFLQSVDTYAAIWANSEFTRGWIRRYWNRPSTVLYPPIDVEDFRPGQKRRQILSVGRFFAGSHNKKHLVMIAAFKQMVDQGLAEWELHLAGGGVAAEAYDSQMQERYLQQVRIAAEGYPIIVHVDLPFAELAKLYGESAIYWHASGFGEDEERNPIRFEHFGITTVEAMAAGCVPVVIGKGGQKEIVKHGQNGFLWNTTDELATLTWRVIKDPTLRQTLADAAIRDSRRYDKAHFQSRLQELLRDIGIEA